MVTSLSTSNPTVFMCMPPTDSHFLSTRRDNQSSLVHLLSTYQHLKLGAIYNFIFVSCHRFPFSQKHLKTNFGSQPSPPLMTSRQCALILLGTWNFINIHLLTYITYLLIPTRFRQCQSCIAGSLAIQLLSHTYNSCFLCLRSVLIVDWLLVLLWNGIQLLSTAEKVLPCSEPLLNDVVFSVCALTTVKQYGYRCTAHVQMFVVCWFVVSERELCQVSWYWNWSKS